MRRPTLVGPLFAQELLRLTRRGTHFLLRVMLALLLLFAVNLLYPAETELHSLQSVAKFAERLFTTISLLQLVIVWLLTPWFAGSVLTEEREQKTLDLMLTTTLSSRDIVVGKLMARLVFVGGVILAGLPIFAGLTLFGGVSFSMLAMVYAGTLLNLFAIGGLTAGVAASVGTFRATFVTMSLMLTALAFTPAGPMWIEYALSGVPIARTALISFVLLNLLTSLAGIAVAVHSVRPWESEPVNMKRPRQAHPVRQRLAAPPVQRAGIRPDFNWSEPRGPCPGPAFTTIALWAFAAAACLGVMVGLAVYEVETANWMAGMSLAWIPSAMIMGLMISASISREREADTLLMLVTVPAERSEILWRKILAAVKTTLAVWLITAALGTLILFATIDTWYWSAAFLAQGLAMFTATLGVGAYIAVNCRTTFLAQSCAIFAALLAGAIPQWGVLVLDERFVRFLPIHLGMLLSAGALGWWSARRDFDRYRLK